MPIVIDQRAINKNGGTDKQHVKNTEVKIAQKLVYFRFADKVSYRYQLNRIDLEEVRQELMSRKKILNEALKFIYEGKELESLKELRQDKDRHIVHVLIRQSFSQQNLEFVINFGSQFKKTYSTSSKTLVKNFISQVKKQLKFNRIDIIHLGQYINYEKSFEDAMVSKHSQLYAVNFQLTQNNQDQREDKIVPVSLVFDVHSQKIVDSISLTSAENLLKATKTRQNLNLGFQQLKASGLSKPNMILNMQDLLFYGDEQLAETNSFLRSSIMEIRGYTK